MNEETKKLGKNEEGKKFGKNELLIGVIVIITLIYSINGMIRDYKKEDVTVFTWEEIEKINRFKEIQDTEKSGTDILVYKDSEGRMMIGWDD